MKIRPFRLWTTAVVLSACFAARNIEAAPAPSITAQPRSQTNFFGSNVVFTVTATGQTSLFYQWSFDGTNLTDNGHISGSTTTNLTVNSITTSDAGNYRVVVTNSHGSATSSNATLTVLVPATITIQPTNQSVLLSNNVTFTATATGTPPLAYRWYFNGTALADGGRVSGSGTANLTIFDVQTNDAGPYELVVTNSYRMATSAVAVLTVLVPAAITISPTNQSVLQSSNVRFTAGATGTAPLSYQWYFNGSPLVDGGPVSGSETAGLNISNVQTNNGGSYQLVVTNSYGSAASALATLTVVVPAGITMAPTNEVALLGGATVFSAAGSGTGPLFYQWQKDGVNLADGGRLSGTASPALTISNIQMRDAGNYSVIVSNSYNAAAAGASLLVEPVIGWGDDTYGETTIPEGFSNAIAIATGGYYAEYVNLALKADSTVSSSGSVPPGLSNVVQVSAGYRHAAALKSDGTVAAFGDDSFGQTNVPSGLSNVVTISAGGDFTVAVKNDGTVAGWGYALPPAGLSNILTVSSGDFHSLAIQSDDTVIGWGYNEYGEATPPAGLSNVVAVSAGAFHDLALKSDGTVVAWGYNYFGETNVPAGLSNVTAVAAGFYHSLALKSDGTVVAWGDNDNGQATPPTWLTNVVGITAGSMHSLALVQDPDTPVPPGIFWQGATNRSVPTGYSAVFLPVVTGALPMSFQWLFNNAPLPEETNRWLLLSAIQPDQAGSYQFVVSNSYGSAISQVVTVSETPGIVMQPTNESVLLGSNASFSATALSVGALNYQWYFNGTALIDGGRVNGSATPNLNVTDVQTNDAGSYQLVVSNSYGTATSSAATLTVLVPANIMAQPASQSVLLSNSVAFSASAIGTAPLAYQWYFNGGALTDGGRVTGSTTTNLHIANVQTIDSGAYQLVVTNSYGSRTSMVATLTVLVPSMIISQPSNQSVILNSNASFSASAAGDAPLVFQWYFNGVPMSDGGRASGSATSNLTIANVQTNDAGSYQLIVTNQYGTATSTAATLTILVPAAITASPTNRTVLSGSNVTFSVSAIGTAPLSYAWYSNGIALSNGGRISGANSGTLTISNTQTNDSAAYEAIVANSYGAATSSVATLTVLAPVQITGQPSSQAALLGSNVTFAITASGSGPLSYQWYFNGGALTDGGRISGSATPVLTISNVQSSDSGGYVAIVTNFLSSAKSLTASLTPQAVLAPSTRYVALTSTNPMAPYLDWTTAATNIQDAVDAAVAGDLVLVSNGVYNVGGRVVYGSISNRVVVNKAVMVQSFNGPAATVVVGFLGSPAGTFHPGRCVYLTNGASLVGFALTNGAANNSGDLIREESGGAIWCETAAVVSNCIIASSIVGPGYGGGVFGGTLINCELTNNSAGKGGGAASNTLFNCNLAYNKGSGLNLNYGGGAYGCVLSNCLLVGNQAIAGSGFGGGAAYSTLTSCVLSNNGAGASGGGLYISWASGCLISSNRALANGGGAFSNVLNNCVVKNNFGARVGGGIYYSVLTNCTVVSNSAVSVGGVNGAVIVNSIVYDNAGANIQDGRTVLYTCSIPNMGSGGFTNAPLFVNEAAGDLHLQSNSPCINSGRNTYVTSTTDFDGDPRIVGGTVDIGAYEYQTPTSVISYAWLQQYGLPTDGSVDYADLDGTGFNVYQDWIAGLNPTNSTSVLAMQIPVVNTNSIGLTVSWLSVNNRTYYLQRAANLAAQPVFSTIQSNIAGQAGTTSFTDVTATNGGPYFYRVGVQQ